jgi:hypothetical protein
MNNKATLSRQCFHGERLELEGEVVQATVHCVLNNDSRQTTSEEIWVKVLEVAHKLGLSALRASRLAYIARRERGLVITERTSFWHGTMTSEICCSLVCLPCPREW